MLFAEVVIYTSIGPKGYTRRRFGSRGLERRVSKYTHVRIYIYDWVEFYAASVHKTKMNDGRCLTISFIHQNVKLNVLLAFVCEFFNCRTRPTAELAISRVGRRRW